MRKSDAEQRHGSATSRAHLDRELERLGVGGELRSVLAERLADLAPSLGEDGMRAALAGVAAAHDVHRLGEQALQRSARDLQEIQRLLSAFAEEMTKLDEALRILSAYVQRMRTRARPPAGPRVLH